MFPIIFAKMEAKSASNGSLVICHIKIPIPEITKQAMSVFAQPPIPYLIERRNIKRAGKTEDFQGY